jgi:hypothetical protein
MGLMEQIIIDKKKVVVLIACLGHEPRPHGGGRLLLNLYL